MLTVHFYLLYRQSNAHNSPVQSSRQRAVKGSLERGVLLGLLELELRVGRHGVGCSVAGELPWLHVSRTTIRLVLRGRTSRGVS